MYSLLASGEFCYLVITFANSLGSDRDRQSGYSDSVPERNFKKLFFKKVIRCHR